MGYNLGAGGDGGDNISNHPYNKLIRNKLSKASKKQHSEAMSGERNPNYGNKWGFQKGLMPINAFKKLEEVYGEERVLEIKEKIRQGNLGIKKPGTAKAMRENNPSWRSEVKEKLSKASKGRTFTKEQKRHMSESHTGKVLSEKHKLNIGRANSGKKNGRYIHIDKDTENKIIALYNDGFNLTNISKVVGLSTRKISKFLKEKGIEIKNQDYLKTWRIYSVKNMGN